MCTKGSLGRARRSFLEVRCKSCSMLSASALLPGLCDRHISHDGLSHEFSKEQTAHDQTALAARRFERPVPVPPPPPPNPASPLAPRPAPPEFDVSAVALPDDANFVSSLHPLPRSGSETVELASGGRTGFLYRARLISLEPALPK